MALMFAMPGPLAKGFLAAAQGGRVGASKIGIVYRVMHNALE
jgi:hypothetical protein